LALNQLIGEKDAMTAETLPRVQMPNRDNFINPVSGSDLASVAIVAPSRTRPELPRDEEIITRVALL